MPFLYLTEIITGKLVPFKGHLRRQNPSNPNRVTEVQVPYIHEVSKSIITPKKQEDDNFIGVNGLQLFTLNDFGSVPSSMFCIAHGGSWF